MMTALPGFFREWLAYLEPHPYLEALVIIVAFLLLAAIVDRLISGIVSRLVAKTETDLDDRLLAIMHRPIFTTVALAGVWVATSGLELSLGWAEATTSMVQTILIIIWMVFGLRFSSLMLGAMKQQEVRFDFVQQTTEPLLKNALAVLMVLAAAYAILIAWGQDVTGLIASAGILGLALSFAAKDTLANLFAGVAILADRPYQIGHYIILDGGERGEVTHIGLRSTRLLTRDDVEVSIPNSVVGNAKIVNEAAGTPHHYRLRVAVGVAYGSDIDKVTEVLLGVGTSHPETRTTPEPRVRFRESANRGRVVHELNTEVYKEFAEAGISIPFPQRDLHIKEMPGG